MRRLKAVVRTVVTCAEAAAHRPRPATTGVVAVAVASLALRPRRGLLGTYWATRTGDSFDIDDIHAAGHDWCVSGL